MMNERRGGAAVATERRSHVRRPRREMQSRKHNPAKAPATAEVLTFRPTADDLKLIDAIASKLGLNRSSVLRMGVHVLAAREGIKKER